MSVDLKKIHWKLNALPKHECLEKRLVDNTMLWFSILVFYGAASLAELNLPLRCKQ